MILLNSADDFINPPELGVAEREMKRVHGARFVLLPASEETHGHATYLWAAVWQQFLAQLLEASKRDAEAGASAQ
jgi:homoserine O-acetyltransferase